MIRDFCGINEVFYIKIIHEYFHIFLCLIFGIVIISSFLKISLYDKNSVVLLKT